MEFAAGHDVETRAQVVEQLEDREIAVGLHGVADQGICRCEGLGEAAVGSFDGRLAIDVERRAGRAGEIRHRHVSHSKLPPR